MSFVAGVAVSAVAGYLGTLMLSQKMSITAGPLGHLAFPGVALAILYDLNISLGAFPFIILGVGLIWLLEIRTRLPKETLAAIVFAFGVGVSLLFLPIEKAEAALVGNIWEIDPIMTFVTVILSLVVALVIHLTYQKMMLINIYEDLAKTEGINVRLSNFLYLISIAIVVALGVTLVGGLLTVAIVAIPAATAKNFSSRLGLYKGLAVVFGVLSTATGMLVSQAAGLPAGPMIIVVAISLFFVSVFLKASK